MGDRNVRFFSEEWYVIFLGGAIDCPMNLSLSTLFSLTGLGTPTRIFYSLHHLQRDFWIDLLNSITYPQSPISYSLRKSYRFTQPIPNSLNCCIMVIMEDLFNHDWTLCLTNSIGEYLIELWTSGATQSNQNSYRELNERPGFSISQIIKDHILLLEGPEFIYEPLFRDDRKSKVHPSMHLFGCLHGLFTGHI